MHADRLKVVYSPKDRDWPGPPKQLCPNLISQGPVYSEPDLLGGGVDNQNPPLLFTSRDTKAQESTFLAGEAVEACLRSVLSGRMQKFFHLEHVKNCATFKNCCSFSDLGGTNEPVKVATLLGLGLRHVAVLQGVHNFPEPSIDTNNILA